MHALFNFLSLFIRLGLQLKFVFDCYSRFVVAPVFIQGTWWRRWLRHCAILT